MLDVDQSLYINENGEELSYSYTRTDEGVYVVETKKYIDSELERIKQFGKPGESEDVVMVD